MKKFFIYENEREKIDFLGNSYFISLLEEGNTSFFENENEDESNNEKDKEIKNVEDLQFSDEIILFVKNIIAQKTVIVKFQQQDEEIFLKFQDFSEILSFIANNNEILRKIFINPNIELSEPLKKKNLKCYNFFKNIKNGIEQNIKDVPFNLVVGFGTLDINLKIIFQDEKTQIVFSGNEESQFFNLNSEEELENVWSDLFLKILEFLKNSQNANVEETKRLKI